MNIGFLDPLYTRGRLDPVHDPLRAGAPDHGLVDLGPVDRPAHRVHAAAAVPAVHEADQEPARDAAAAAQDRRAEEEVPGRPAEAEPRADALFKEHGVNPLAGCLPLLVQMPIFFALFGVLHKFVQNKGATGSGASTYAALRSVARRRCKQVAESKVFGVPIAAVVQLEQAAAVQPQRHRSGTVKTVTVIMIVLMMATSFLTSRQMLARSKKSGQRARRRSGDDPEGHGLRHAAVLRRHRRQLPDGRAALLADHQRVDVRPAVLRHQGRWATTPRPWCASARPRQRPRPSGTKATVATAPTFAAGRGDASAKKKAAPLAPATSNAGTAGTARNPANPGGSGNGAGDPARPASRPGGANRNKRKGGRH